MEISVGWNATVNSSATPKRFHIFDLWGEFTVHILYWLFNLSKRLYWPRVNDFAVGIVTTNNFPQSWPRTNPGKLWRCSIQYKNMAEQSSLYIMSASPSGGGLTQGLFTSWLMTYLQQLEWEGRESVKCQGHNRGLSRFGCIVESHKWCWHSGFQNYCCTTKIMFRGWQRYGNGKCSPPFWWMIIWTFCKTTLIGPICHVCLEFIPKSHNMQMQGNSQESSSSSKSTKQIQLCPSLCRILLLILLMLLSNIFSLTCANCFINIHPYLSCFILIRSFLYLLTSPWSIAVAQMQM